MLARFSAKGLLYSAPVSAAPELGEAQTNFNTLYFHSGRNITHIGALELNGERIDRPNRQHEVQLDLSKFASGGMMVLFSQSVVEPLKLHPS